MHVPVLETERLLIRDFHMDDLPTAHEVLDVDQRWLEWTILGYEQLPRLHQMPYGDRAIVLKHTAELIGACGYAPCLAPFDQLPALRPDPTLSPRGGNLPEVGLFWSISPAHQRQGYATEAARALVAHGFDALALHRIVATTEYANTASIGVMRKLGMRIERNPLPDPFWLQVVGVLDAPSG